jgi:hypothetical protein
MSTPLLLETIEKFGKVIDPVVQKVKQIIA